MAFPRPVIRSIRILGVWTGEPKDPVEYKVTFNVHAYPNTQLPLLDLTSERVELIQVFDPYDPAMHVPSPYEAVIEPVPRSRLLSPYPFSPPEKSQTKDNEWREAEVKQFEELQDALPHIEDVDDKEKIPVGSEDCRSKVINVSLQDSESSLPTIDVSLPSRPSSPEERNYKGDVNNSTSPVTPIPRLNVKKRSSISPLKPSSSPTQGKFLVTKRIRQPIPVTARPPWRTPGTDEVTARGRKVIHGKEEVTLRKISQSADGRFQTAKTHGHRGPSPSSRRKVKPMCSMDDLKVGRSRPFAVGTMVKISPRKRKTMTFDSEAVRDQQSSTCAAFSGNTAPETKQYEQKGTSQLMERWFESRRSLEEDPQDEQDVDDLFDSHTVRSSRSIMSLGADSMEDDVQDIDNFFMPTHGVFQSSPADSYHASKLNNDMAESEDSLTRHLPWIRKDEKLWLDFHKEAKQSCVVVVKAKVKAMEYSEGGLILSIPGLPLQYDNKREEGHFMLIINTEEHKLGYWNNRDRIRWVQEDRVTRTCSIEELEEGRRYGPFPLDEVFAPRFVQLESTKLLSQGQYELDYVVSERKDFTKGIVCFSATCILRPARFIFWSEHVTLKLCLSGGPSGATLNAFLAPGYRHVHLRSRQVEPSHQLYLVITCPTSEWEKAFVITWEGPVRKDRLHPSISGGCAFNDLDIQNVWAGHAYGQFCNDLDGNSDDDVGPAGVLATTDQTAQGTLFECLKEDGSIVPANDCESREGNISRLREKAMKRSQLGSTDDGPLSYLESGTSIIEDLDKLGASPANRNLKGSGIDGFATQFPVMRNMLIRQIWNLWNVFAVILTTITMIWLCCWVTDPYKTTTWTWQTQNSAVQWMHDPDFAPAFSAFLPSGLTSRWLGSEHPQYQDSKTTTANSALKMRLKDFKTFDTSTATTVGAGLMARDSVFEQHRSAKTANDVKATTNLRDRIDRYLGWPGPLPQAE